MISLKSESAFFESPLSSASERSKIFHDDSVSIESFTSSSVIFCERERSESFSREFPIESERVSRVHSLHDSAFLYASIIFFI